MNKAPRVMLAYALVFTVENLRVLFSRVTVYYLFYVWPCNLVFQHGIKADGRGRIMVV